MTGARESDAHRDAYSPSSYNNRAPFQRTAWPVCCRVYSQIFIPSERAEKLCGEIRESVNPQARVMAFKQMREPDGMTFPPGQTSTVDRDHTQSATVPRKGLAASPFTRQ